MYVSQFRVRGWSRFGCSASPRRKTQATQSSVSGCLSLEIRTIPAGAPNTYPFCPPNTYPLVPQTHALGWLVHCLPQMRFIFGSIRDIAFKASHPEGNLKL